MKLDIEKWSDYGKFAKLSNFHQKTYSWKWTGYFCRRNNKQKVQTKEVFKINHYNIGFKTVRCSKNDTTEKIQFIFSLFNVWSIVNETLTFKNTNRDVQDWAFWRYSKYKKDVSMKKRKFQSQSTWSWLK